MPGCSTTQLLLRLAEYITSGLELKWTTVAVFLDISNAYDSSWHTGLRFKWIQIKIPGELIKVIDSHLSHRSFIVQMDGKHSEWKPCYQVFHRVQPYSLLYNLYTSDTLKSITTELAVYTDRSVRFAHQAASPSWHRRVGNTVVHQHHDQ
jgi:Reverse transcriptase (RNA-dependent DNA polymerase).